MSCAHCKELYQQSHKKQIYCSLSCSNRARRLKNETKYYENPKQCPICDTPISYNKRHDSTYCSRSCSAKFNNVKNKIPKFCKNCQKELNPKQTHRRNKYCSCKCQNIWQWENVIIPKIKKGEVYVRTTLKKYLLSINGHYCWDCGNATWKDEKIPLDLDHVDGNPGNDMPENLRLLCPNCHALTPTANGKNKGYGRKSRGLPR